MTITTSSNSNIQQDAATVTKDKQKWRTLAVISIIQFILLLDATIVNVALPSIKTDLVLTDASLTWIVNAYYIAAGSLLLFGGKLGDAFGIRKIFMFGITIFGAFSFLAAIAPAQCRSVDIGPRRPGLGRSLSCSNRAGDGVADVPVRAGPR